MPLRLHARLAALLLVTLCAAAVFGPHPSAQAQPAEMSPDEAALQLRPYLLTKSNAPAGLATAVPYVWTPALYAYVTRERFGMSPAASLAQFQADGLVLVFGQILQGKSGSDFPPNSSITAYLMRSGDDARKFVDLQAVPEISDRPNVLRIDSTVTVGDYSRLYRFNVGSPDEQYSLRWARGNIAYAVYGPTDAAADTYTALAEAIDAVEATNPPVDLGSPQLVPPATETESLQAIMRLESVEPSTVALPRGFLSDIPTFSSVAGRVLVYPDPVATLARYDGDWRRVMREEHKYTLADGEVLYLDLSEDASPDAARVDERDVLVSPSDTITPLTEGVRFGDDNYAFAVTSVRSDGSPFDSIDYSWLHGSLLLSVQLTAPSGSLDASILPTFAQAVEDAYQQSLYVRN